MSSEFERFNARTLASVVEQSRQRGVRLDQYSQGVEYDPSVRCLLGRTTLDLSPGSTALPIITATGEVWAEAFRSGLPVEELLEYTVEHELNHCVQLSRCRRGFIPSAALQPDLGEAIAFGTLDRINYANFKRGRLSRESIRWIEGQIRGGKSDCYDPFLFFARFQFRDRRGNRIVPAWVTELIEREIGQQEYLEALGLT